MAGLYIHIPYCHHRCIYCDFYSVGSKSAPWQEFVSRLIGEFQLRCNDFDEDINTLYLGGGTPSQMPTNQLQRLIDSLQNIANDRWRVSEFTIEANPEDITEEYLSILTNIGINRISIGVQTFCDEELKIIGRRHTSSEAIKAIERASKIIKNISIDLIFGLPGQTLKSWKETVNRALNLVPNHISAYSLMREPGTAIDIMLKQKRIEVADETLSLQMFEYLTSTLNKSGFEQYEISNYAQPGYHSVHNLSYWQSKFYMGIGPAAHSYDGLRVRRANNADVKEYIFSDINTDVPHVSEILTDSELLEEYVMTRLRTATGININEAISILGSDLAFLLDSRCKEELVYRPDLLKATEKGYALTHNGVMLADSVITDIGFR